MKLSLSISYDWGKLYMPSGKIVYMTHGDLLMSVLLTAILFAHNRFCIMQSFTSNVWNGGLYKMLSREMQLCPISMSNFRIVHHH